MLLQGARDIRILLDVFVCVIEREIAVIAIHDVVEVRSLGSYSVSGNLYGRSTLGTLDKVHAKLLSRRCRLGKKTADNWTFRQRENLTNRILKKMPGHRVPVPRTPSPSSLFRFPIPNSFTGCLPSSAVIHRGSPREAGQALGPDE